MVVEVFKVPVEKPMAPPKSGSAAPVMESYPIALVIMSGGAFNVLVETGALQVLIAKVVAKFGNKEAIFIPLLLLVFAAIATTQSVTVFIGFTPVIIMMTKV